MSYDLEVYASRPLEVPAVRWSVQISTSPKQGAAARRLAKAIASNARGVVYDPQEDAIVWPRNPAKLRTVAASRAKGDDDWNNQVELRWLVSRRLTGADAHRLLAVLRDALPEGVPVRFGDDEPMQGRLERDGVDAFAAYWDGDTSMFWSGRAPVTGGHVSLNRGWGAALPPEERAALIPTIAGRPGLRPDDLSTRSSPSVASTSA